MSIACSKTGESMHRIWGFACSMYREIPNTIREYLMEEQPLILVVDDSERIARLAMLMLHSAGYQTSYVSSGLEALTSAQKLRPDLILLDYHMPDIDGLEVIRRL